MIASAFVSPSASPAAAGVVPWGKSVPPPPPKAALLLEPLEPRIMLNGVPGFAPALDYDPPGFDAAALLAGELVETPSMLDAGEDDFAPASPVFDPDPVVDAGVRNLSGPAPAGLASFPDFASAAPRIMAEAEEAARADAEAEASARVAGAQRLIDRAPSAGGLGQAADEQPPASFTPAAPSGSLQGSAADAGTDSDADPQKSDASLDEQTSTPFDPITESAHNHKGNLLTPQGYDELPPGGCEFPSNDYLLVHTDAVSGLGDTLSPTAHFSGGYLPKDSVVTFTVSMGSQFSEQYTKTITSNYATQASVTTDSITQSGLLKVSATAALPQDEGGGTIGPALDDQNEPIPDVAGDKWCIGISPSYHTDDDGLQSNEEYAAMVDAVNLRMSSIIPSLTVNEHPIHADGNGGYTADAGLRIFPGKASPDDLAGESARRIVLTADILPLLDDTPDLTINEMTGEWEEDNDPWTLEGQEVNVVFRSFDVDDPSSTLAPVDDTDASGVYGEDNESGGSFFFSRSQSPLFPDSTKVSTRFDVSMQPGDNYRFAAAGEGFGLDTLTSDLNDAAASGQPRHYVAFGNDQIQGFEGELTQSLTVWRELHVERDSMGAPGTSTTFDADDQAVSNVADPDTSLLAGAFGPAYVEVLFDTGNDNSDAAWDYHLEVEDDELLAQGQNNRQTPESDEYWVGYIQGVYEGPPNLDGDDPSESYRDGYNLGAEPEYAFLYQEVERQVAQDNGWDETLLEKRTVAHEIGHQFELDHNEGTAGGLMHKYTDPTLRSSAFLPQRLAEIRSVDSP